ncbi:MAG: tetratricopeptide repeat protein [Chlorobium sp.]|nr:MAG: tetratricopeptide repeat protein [Chlorobium sp.]
MALSRIYKPQKARFLMKHTLRFLIIAVMTLLFAGSAALAKDNGFSGSGKGLSKEAIAEFTRTIEHSQRQSKAELAKAYCQRGVAERALGDIEAAQADFRKAIELDPTPKDAVAYTNRGIAKSALGDIEGASSDFKMAAFLSDNSGQQG